MPFVCPVCGAESHKPYDEIYGWCEACNAFVLPAVAQPRDEQASIDWQTEENRAMEKLDQTLRRRST